MDQGQIDRELAKLKEWYYDNWSLCIFCNHIVRKEGDLAHLIRRSASRELQTLKLNTGLAHRECHDIFDNKPREVVFLPRFYECIYLIFLIDSQYYNQMIGTLYQDICFPDFFAISNLLPSIEHHGELLTLLPYIKSPSHY